MTTSPSAASTALACRSCGAGLGRTFVDLGRMPLANSYLDVDQLRTEEPRYPLHARVCEGCLLVQVESVVPPEEIFTDYAYFSSYSPSWVEHARRFADAARHDLGLTADSLVVEVASNDGYLLKHFLAKGIPVLGVEPAVNVAKVAIEAGVPTETAFFGAATARDLVQRGLQADLLVANNVLAHVPDLADFVTGMVTVLAPDGVVSIEVPWVLRLIQEVQFDTIYHEHFSYFSLLTVEHVLGRHGLTVFHVDELPTHGGSLRIWACHRQQARSPSPELLAVRAAEEDAGIGRLETYAGFQRRVDTCRQSLTAFLGRARADGDTVVGYGAAAKGNTLLNYCGVTAGDIAYVVDRNPHKQGRFLPGSHLPIADPAKVFETRPRYLLVLPWNLRDEIVDQMAGIRAWGGRFVIPVPETEVVE